MVSGLPHSGQRWKLQLLGKDTTGGGVCARARVLTAHSLQFKNVSLGVKQALFSVTH